MRTFHHFGIPVKDVKEGASYNEDLKLWLTDIVSSPNHFEFLKFEEGSCMPAIIQELPHAAYIVPSLDEELKDKEVLFGPVEVNGVLRIAFIQEEGIPIEVMEHISKA